MSQVRYGFFPANPLRSYRDACGVTGSAIANRLGYSGTWVKDWELRMDEISRSCKQGPYFRTTTETDKMEFVCELYTRTVKDILGKWPMRGYESRLKAVADDREYIEYFREIVGVDFSPSRR